MIQQLNVYRYIGYNNPQKAYDLLLSEGYTNIKKEKEYVSALLAHFVAQEGEDALKKIFDIHPDKEEILELFPKPINGVKVPNRESLSRLEDCDECKFKSATGDDPTTEPKLSEKTINTLIIGGSAVLGVTLVALIIINIRNT